MPAPDRLDRRPTTADPRDLRTTILVARARALPPWSGFETLRDIARAGAGPRAAPPRRGPAAAG